MQLATKWLRFVACQLMCRLNVHNQRATFVYVVRLLVVACFVQPGHCCMGAWGFCNMLCYAIAGSAIWWARNS
jgi:hypothetical protein